MGRLFDDEFPQGEAYTIPELPLWATRLSVAARRAGWEPHLVDLARYTGPFEAMPVPRMAEEALRFDSPVVALSPFTANYELAVEMAAAIRARRPGTILALGGAHASELPQPCLTDGFDHVATGRGEAALEHLLSRLGSGRPVEAGFPGLLSRDSGSAAPRPEDRSLYQSYWEAAAHYDVVPAGYAMHYARVYALLGCPYRCSFCADTLWIGMRPYQRDVSRLREEVLAIRERFHPRALFVGDEVFTMKQAYAHEVASLLGEAGIPWFCQTRANLLVRAGDPPLLRAMAENGCRRINIGAESTDPAVLKGLDKRITDAQLVQACTNAKEAGLGVLTYWMIGAPHETRATARNTLATITGLFDSGLTDLVDYFICTPYPGTLIYKDPGRYEVTIARKPWRLWREDIPSVMSTATLAAEEIYELWLTGLEAITTAMYNSQDDRARRVRAAISSGH